MLPNPKRAQLNNILNQDSIIKLLTFIFDCTGIFKHEPAITPPVLHGLWNYTPPTLIFFYTLKVKLWIIFLEIKFIHYWKTTRIKSSFSVTDLQLKLGASVYFNNIYKKKMIKFPDFCSIYTAEAYAIHRAL